MDIKKVIKDKGWTLERLASEMSGKDGKKGISQPSLSSIINGNPTINKLQEIASIIGMPLSELVADGDTQTQITCPKCGQIIKIELKPKTND